MYIHGARPCFIHAGILLFSTTFNVFDLNAAEIFFRVAEKMGGGGLGLFYCQYSLMICYPATEYTELS